MVAAAAAAVAVVHPCAEDVVASVPVVVVGMADHRTAVLATAEAMEHPEVEVRSEVDGRVDMRLTSTTWLDSPTDEGPI